MRIFLHILIWMHVSLTHTQTSTISIEALVKVADSSQLTFEFDGTLTYEHSQWIDIRLALEDFLWQVGDVLDRIDDLQEDLARSDFAEDVNGAKHGIDRHNDMRIKIQKIPLEELDKLGQKLLTKLSADSNRTEDPSHSSSATNVSQLPNNPDTAATFLQIRQQREAVHTGQQHLMSVWNHKKNRLDQCFQLRLFEQDCEKVFIVQY